MEFFKPGRYFNFMSQRKLWALVSLAVVSACLVSLFYPGLNLGTDFKGGTEIEVAFQQPVSAGDLRSTIQRLGFGSPDVIKVQDENNPDRYLLRVQDVSAINDEQRANLAAALCFPSETGAEPAADRCPVDRRPTEFKLSPGGDKITLRYDAAPDLASIAKAIDDVHGVDLRETEPNPQLVSARDNKVEAQLKSKGDQLMDGLRDTLGPEVVPAAPLRVEWVGPKAGKLLRDAAFKSVGIALIFMMAYIAFRFDMRFAPGAVVALLHDVTIVLGIFVITKKEFSLSTVAALLTIVGYSVNDTVVVFDRIRENLGKHRGKNFPTIINLSVSETLSRTVLTSGTTLVSLAAFLMFGSGVIKDFAFALMMGILVGTYSSVYIASPLTEYIDRRFFSKAKVKTATREPTKPAGAVVG